MPEFCEANIGEPVGRRALSVRWRTQAHLWTRSKSGEHRVLWPIIRSSRVHVPLSLTVPVSYDEYRW